MRTDNSEETRAHVQERLALFTKLWAGLMIALSAATLGFYQIRPDLRPPRSIAVHAAAGVAILVLGILWLAVHRGKRALRELRAIDAFSLAVIGTVYGLSAYYSGARIQSAPLTVFVFHTFVAFSRVMIVPSSVERTAVVTSISYVPQVVAAIALAAGPAELPLPPWAYVSLISILAAIAVLLCTTSSRVIYGLRRQAREAMQLGQYTLERKIGAGSMGVVYRARHALLRRPTAIKTLPAELFSGEAVRRFEREAQQLSRLTHPNTVALYDFGHSPDGVLYYVMEFLDGMDLERLVARFGPLPPARVIRILVQVCGSLEEAHAMGLIHRDVKPANIILCRRGLQHDVAKVVDFGLVKEVADGDAGASAVIAGTPAYIAPEAIVDPRAAGPASDVYSLGAAAYVMLTGKRVFDGKTSLELYAQHATAAVVPPSARTDRPIPAALEALVVQCLAKDPAARPAVGALRLALEALPEAEDWDDAQAAAWWAGLDRADLEPSIDPAVTAPTMTIDVRLRQPERTDQATK